MYVTVGGDPLVPTAIRAGFESSFALRLCKGGAAFFGLQSKEGRETDRRRDKTRCLSDTMNSVIFPQKMNLAFQRHEFCA